jgi:hypothetical protein
LRAARESTKIIILQPPARIVYLLQLCFHSTTRCKDPAPSTSSSSRRHRRRQLSSSSRQAKAIGDALLSPLRSAADDGILAAAAGLISADSPRRLSALKILTPEHRVDFGSLVALELPPPPTEATTPPTAASPLESPKASEAVDNTEDDMEDNNAEDDDYVMLDAADLVLPLHPLPPEN